nr:MAG TPA: hypothetical protein [Caudoviricetes sp.]
MGTFLVLSSSHRPLANPRGLRSERPGMFNE